MRDRPRTLSPQCFATVTSGTVLIPEEEQREHHREEQQEEEEQEECNILL